MAGAAGAGWGCSCGGSTRTAVVALHHKAEVGLLGQLRLVSALELLKGLVDVLCVDVKAAVARHLRR